MTGFGRSRVQLAGAAMALTVMLACKPADQQPVDQSAKVMSDADQGGGVRATPAPGFTVTDSAQHDMLMSYGARLDFDTTVTAMDEQYLFIDAPRGGVAQGPWLSVSPERGTTALARTSLAQGRIIARATLIGGNKTVTAYWYVDSVAQGWRSIWVSDAPNYHWVETSVAVHGHGAMGRTTAARARIILTAPPMLAATRTKICEACTSDPSGWCRDSVFSVSFKPLLDVMPTILGGRPRP